MGKPLELRPGEKQPLTAESLLAPDGVESLVKTGRVPGVMKHSRGAWAIIPPEGTQLGDKITHGAGVGVEDMGYVTFESPDGVKRGAAELVDMTYDQAAQVKSRVATAVKGLKK